MKRKIDREYVVAAIISILFFVAAYYISLGIVRLYALTKEPDPYKWEWVYYSTSPNAKSYHCYKDCKYLSKTKYDIDYYISSRAAEYDGLTPCKYCLEQSRKYQYDESALYLYMPVLIILFSLLAVFDRIRNKHKKHKRSIMALNNNASKDKGLVENMTYAAIKESQVNPSDINAKQTAYNAIYNNIEVLKEWVYGQDKVDAATIHRITELCRILFKTTFMCEMYSDNINKILSDIYNNPGCYNTTILTKELLSVLESNYFRAMCTDVTYNKE